MQKLESGSKTRPFETSEKEAVYPPTPRTEAKTPYCKSYKPVLKTTNVGACLIFFLFSVSLSGLLHAIDLMFPTYSTQLRLFLLVLSVPFLLSSWK